MAASQSTLIPPSSDRCYAMRVADDSLHPRVKLGEYVLIDSVRSCAPGDEVLVVTRDGRSMVKVLVRRDGLVVLQSINGSRADFTLSEDEIEEIHYLAGFSREEPKGIFVYESAEVSDKRVAIRDPLPPLPTNPEAQAAWDELSDAIEDLSSDLLSIAYVSVGAPGSAELLRNAALLVQEAREVIRPVMESAEEQRRFDLFSAYEKRELLAKGSGS